MSETALHARLLRWFRWRVGHNGDAEDLAQETFARYYSANTAHVDEPAAYLRRIAVNLDIEQRRRFARRGGVGACVEIDPEKHAAGEELSPERILIAKEEVRRVMQLLDELPERSRAVFVLSRFEHMTGAQIAARFGISASAVEKHMMRVLSHLRNGLERE